MGLQDNLKVACRRLRGAPIFATFSIATLALGIGATTAAYSVIHVVTGPPPGVTDAVRLVEIYHFPVGSVPITNLSWDDYQDLRRRQTVFESLTGWSWFRPSVVASGYSETAIGEIVDGDYFHTLGVSALVGRSLEPRDDRPEAPPVVVISAMLQRRIFGDEGPIGKTIKISGTSFEIVGVADPEFAGLFNGGLLATHVWVPIATARNVFPELRENFDSRERRWVFVRGRLGSQVNVAQANAQVSAIAKQLDDVFPIGRNLDRRLKTPYDITRPWGVRPLGPRIMGVSSQVLTLVLGALSIAVVLVCLIACTNITNLMLARNGRRRSQILLRAALGASRGRLVYEAMFEPLLLAVAGGAAGLGVARVLMRLLSVQIPVGNGATLQALPRVDGVVLSLTAVATILSLLIVGIGPAIQSTRVNLRSALDLDGGSVSQRWHGRGYLIAAQVAVSAALVLVATLYMGEARRQSDIDTGVDLRHLAIAQVDFGTQRYEPMRARQVAAAVVARLAADRNVRSSAVMSGLPAGLTSTHGAALRAIDGIGTTSVSFVAGSPAMFDTLGVAVVRGRGFDGRDVAEAPHVIILSETASLRLFGGSDPIGRGVVFERRRAVGEPAQTPSSMTVVGLVRDTDSGAVGRRDIGVAYLPLEQHYESGLVLVARTYAEPTRALFTLRAAISSTDPSLAVAQTGTGMSLAGPDTAFPLIVAAVATSLGATGLMVALAGLFGVLSHLVTLRTREIGIRLALGARTTAIQWMVLRDGLRPILVGLVGGLGLVVIVRTALQLQFTRLIPTADLGLMILVPLLFVGAGILASCLPAIRASRVHPNVALRDL